MSIFNTTCSECIFNTGNKKVKCALGRYEVFKEQGRTDGDKINGLCTACRDSEWRKLHKITPKTDVKKELQSRYSQVIVDIDKDGRVLEKLKLTLSHPQTITPMDIILVYEGEDVMVPINDLLKEYTHDKNIKYSIIRVVEQEYEGHIIDIAAKKCGGIFYLIQHNGVPTNKQIFERLYIYTEEQLKSVLVVDSLCPTWHETVVNSLYHKRVDGFYDSDLFSKTTILQEDENMDWLSISMTELFEKTKGKE